MLRASSGKHARLVGVCRAGGDSIPAEPAEPADPELCPNRRSLDKDLDVSTSGKFAWFVVLRYGFRIFKTVQNRVSLFKLGHNIVPKSAQDVRSGDSQPDFPEYWSIVVQQ